MAKFVRTAEREATRHTNVVLPIAARIGLEDLAIAQRTTVSALMRRAVDEFLKRAPTEGASR